MILRKWTGSAAGLLAGAVLMAGMAAAPGQELEELAEMSLEELMNIEVTSVSKKPEKRWEAAAALYVITREDIRRSGVTTLADALRLAPGVHVARIDANKWAVSVRGFSGRFTNKLLVLIDGRSVYTPLFAGVYWDVQDLLLDDVERIEVIRGPGGTLWGANAVNGVINIITRNARQTQGAYVTSAVGNEEKFSGAARLGGKAGQSFFYRLWVKYFDRDGGHDPRGTAADDWEVGRAGLRADWEPGGRDRATFEAAYYKGDAGQRERRGGKVTASTTGVTGGYLLGRWRHRWVEAGQTSVRAYFDRTERRETVFGEIRNTFDVELQHRLDLPGSQELVAGIQYRLTSDDISGPLSTALDRQRNDQLAGIFLEDEISFFQDRLRLTAGSKFSHNDYSGFEVQPSVRALLLPSDRHTLWAAISRAVRTPSRAGDGIVVTQPVDPRAIRIDGKTDSEKLLAFELGYRARPASNLFVDVAAFFNDYEDLTSLEAGDPFPDLDSCTDPEDPQTCEVIRPLLVRNKMDGQAFGVEVSASWEPVSAWRISGNYSFLDVDLRRAPDSNDLISTATEKASPVHQASLRSSWDLSCCFSLDGTLRFVDALPGGDPLLGFRGTPSYLDADARLFYRPREGIEVELVGRNLLHDHHREFAEPRFSPLIGTDVQRSLYLRLTWRH